MPARVRITDQFSLVKRDRSDRWYLEWRERGKKVRRATGSSDLEAARQRARELILAGVELRNESAAEIAIADVLDRYRLQRGDKLPSKDTVKRACKLWAAFWGDRPVSDATASRQEEFAAWLAERSLSRGYVRRVLSVGKAALNRAWKRGEIQQVPFVELPPIGDPYPHFAAREQLVALLNTAMPEHVWAYCLVRLCTGCRGDAALDLQTFQIDRAARLIRLNPPGREQTKKFRPVIPLTDTLARYLEQTKPAAHVVHWHGQKVASIKTTWRKLRTRAALPAWFAPKVLRHTVATELRRRGVPDWEAAGQLGHRKAGTTETYAKFDPAYLGKARKALDAWMRDLAKDVPRLRGATAGPRKPKKLDTGIPVSEQHQGLRVVGGTRIELVTPTMSRSTKMRKINN
jgi:integrase